MQAQDILQVPRRERIEALSAPLAVGAAALHLPAAAAAYGGSKVLVNEPMRKLIVDKIMRKAPLTPEEIQVAVRLGLLAGGATGATNE